MESQRQSAAISSFTLDDVFEAIEKEQDPKIRKEKIDIVREQLEMRGVFLQLKFEELRDTRERRQDQREEQRDHREKLRDEREERYVLRSYWLSIFSLAIAFGAVIFTALNFFGTHSVRMVDHVKVNVMADGSSHHSGCKCNTCLIDSEGGFVSTVCNIGKGNSDTVDVNADVCNMDSGKENTNPAEQDSETSHSSTNTKE